MGGNENGEKAVTFMPSCVPNKKQNCCYWPSRTEQAAAEVI